MHPYPQSLHSNYYNKIKDLEGLPTRWGLCKRCIKKTIQHDIFRVKRNRINRFDQGSQQIIE